MVIAYARVSTEFQSLDRQIDMLAEYGYDKMFTEKYTPRLRCVLFFCVLDSNKLCCHTAHNYVVSLDLGQAARSSIVSKLPASLTDESLMHMARGVGKLLGGRNDA